MIQTIRVTAKNEKEDLRGIHIAEEIGKPITSVRAVRIYRLEGVNAKKAKLLAEKIFCESINQIYSLNKPLIADAIQITEIAYKPGVMNPEVASITKAAEDLGISITAADS